MFWDVLGCFGMTIEEVIDELRRKARSGRSAAAREGAICYRELVTQTVETPEIGPLGGISFSGPNSQPGEYPNKETGQGEANIDHEDDDEASYFGLRGEATGFGPFEPTHRIAGGIHLEILRQRGWKGADDVLIDHFDRIRETYNQAARDA